MIARILTAEQRILGAAMSWVTLNGGAIYPIDWMRGRLDEHDFDDPKHRTIWRAIERLLKDTRPVSTETVYEAICADKQANADIEWASLLVGLVDDSVGFRMERKNVDDAIANVKQASSSRKLEMEAITLRDRAGRESPLELIADTKNRLEIISSWAVTERPPSVREIIDTMFEELEERRELGGAIPGVSSGWPTLDRMTLGWNRRQLAYLAARPSIGKTAFAINAAIDCTIVSQKACAFISLEMGVQDIMARMIANLASVSLHSLRMGLLPDGDAQRRCIEAACKLNNGLLHLRQGSYSIAEIEATARKIKQDSGLDLLVIDYLQLIRARDNAESRNIAVSEISLALKHLAVDLDIPIIALSQLSRNSERRNDRRPTLSDLRDSGSLEQDADIVIFLHRDRQPEVGAASETLVDVAKNRQGECGSIRLQFSGDFQRFTEGM